ncbi:MAG: glycosyltransferase family 4 protein [Gemmatimonadota bacterium]
MRNEAPLRVLMAMDRLGYGEGRYHGAGRLVVDWSCALRERGVDVSTVVLRSAGEFETPDELPVTCLGRGLYDVRTIGDFGRLFRERRIDIAHLQGFGALTFGRLAALPRRIPVVAHIHADHGEETGGYPWFVRAADRVLSRLTTQCIAVSEATKTFAVAQQGFAPSKVAVWHNSVDLARFVPPSAAERAAARAALELPPDVPVVAVVARLDRVKGVDILLDAWPSVVRRVPTARLLVVGEGPLRDDLEARLATHGAVRNSVDFLGYRSDVPHILHAVDLLALPSRSEGMPLAVLEAFACGLPVVAHAVGGVPELVVDGVNGRLVPLRPAALATALADVLSDAGLRERLANAARASVEPLGLWVYTERLELLYREIIERTGRRG